MKLPLFRKNKTKTKTKKRKKSNNMMQNKTTIRLRVIKGTLSSKAVIELLVYSLHI